MLYLIAVYSFITALVIVYILLSAIFNKGSVIKRLEKYNDRAAYKPNPAAKGKDIPSLKEFFQYLLYLTKDIGNLSIFSRYKKNVQAELAKAHILLRGEEFITLSLVISLVFAFIAAIGTRNVLISIVCFFMGWIVPMLYVKGKRKKRLKLLNDQLGDTIALISNSLKAGYSFFQAVDTVTSEMSGSIAEEFAQVKKEINLGVTTENALENLARRVGSDDLELVVTAILIQRQVGGNLAEILDNISDTIRHRIRIKGEIKAMTAQGRISGIIIALIPPVIGLAMSVINPGYISLLFKTSIGLILIGVSVAMELIGALFIRSIIKIEV